MNSKFFAEVRRRIILHGSFWIPCAIALCFLSLRPATAQSDPALQPDPQDKPTSVGDFLGNDGRVDLEAIRDQGYEGTLDTEGFRFRTDEAGHPTFSRRPPGTEGDETWSDEFSIAGTDGPVHVVVAYQGSLIVGGEFLNAGYLPNEVGSIAGWDGTDWFELLGLTGTTIELGACVNAMEVANGELYVGGFFSSPGNNIAKWDGTEWSGLGSGTDDEVLAVESFAGSLYVGGSFTEAGGVTDTDAIARWTGSAWLAVGEGLTGFENSSPQVRALHRRQEDPSVLFVGGDFFQAGTVELHNIGMWDATNWLSLGSAAAEGLDGAVNTIEVHPVNGNAFIGGEFSNSRDGAILNRVTMWPVTDPEWVSLDEGLSGPVLAIALGSDGIYVAGEFTGDFAGTVELNHIARWAIGGFWDPCSEGTTEVVRTLFRHPPGSTTLIVGGDFTLVDGAHGLGAQYIAEWRPGLWDKLDGNGVAGQVNALAVYNGALVIGGDFFSAGGTAATRVAAWDGTDWHGFSTGVGAEAGAQTAETVFALTTFGGQLIAAGDFATAGGVPTANNIAAWDGGTWSELGGSLVGGPVYALASDPSYLYAGGAFNRETGTPGQFLMGAARWDGVNWQPLGFPGFENNGVDDAVRALTIFQEYLVLGGSFTSIYAVGPAEHVAVWHRATGTTIESFFGGGTFDGDILALATNASDSAFYAGGVFTSPEPFVAQWDGGSWLPLDEGGFTIDAPVHALATSGDSLVYVGGEFAFAGPDSASRVATYDGATWSALGSGLDDIPLALIEHEDHLFAGGLFVRAGGKISYHIGERLDDPTSSIPVPEISASAVEWSSPPAPNPSTGAVELQFLLAAGGSVHAELFDVAGRRITTIFEGSAPSGANRVLWDGRSETGETIAPGVYFARLSANGEVSSTKLIRIGE